jgi:membrane protein DedA with SNARE-associated domain
MALLDQTTYLSQIFGEYSYLAPFLVLLLCGVGLPLPEEVTLIGSGILWHQGKVDGPLIMLVCSVAILLGDSVPFWLGRRYGMRALKKRWVARMLHPERIRRTRRRFEEHGNWATFACRFFAGVRLPGYFIAGTMGMRYGRFLLLDLLGVLVSVPISIYLGKVFGMQIDKLQTVFDDLHLLFAFLALSLALIMIVHSRRRKLAKARERGQTDSASGAPPPHEG